MQYPIAPDGPARLGPPLSCLQFIFKGVVAWIASIFIAFLAFAMLRYKGWEDKWARKLAIVKVSDWYSPDPTHQPTPLGRCQQHQCASRIYRILPHW